MNRILTGKIAALIAAVVFAAIAFSGAPVIAVDTPFYVSIADGLEQSPADVLLAKDRVRVTVLALPLLIIAARQVAPDGWPYVIVFFNVLAMAIAGGLLIAIVRMVTQSTLAALAALLLYVAAYDVIAWLRYVLTDNLFALAATLVFYLLIQGIVRDDASPRRRVQLALALLAAFITRATGAVLVAVVVFCEWWSRRKRAGVAPWILLLIVFAGGMLGHAYFFADIRRWPTDLLRPMMEVYAGREKTGEVVYDRVEARREPPQSTFDHVVVQGDRFVRFFQFTTRGFSRMHSLVNTVYYIPLYLLVLVGIIDAIRGADQRRKRIVIVTVLWIVSIAWLHALTILDFDWRHRLPAIPMLILLAACGVEAVIRRYRFRVRSTTYNGRART